MTKINVSRIVQDHLQTLRNQRTSKYVPADFLIFFILPAVVSGFLVAFDRRISAGTISILATGLAIFAGLLFNLLLLVADVAVRADSVDGKHETVARIKLIVLEQLHSNVAFAILLSLVTLLALFGLSLFGTWQDRWIVEFPIYYLSLVFFLTLLMILKRAHAVIAKEVDLAAGR